MIARLRLVLVVSLDGRLAPPHGGAYQLGGIGDRKALEESLAWCDACLVGAGTLRAHRSTCLIHNQWLLEERKASSRSLQPAAVVVSSSSLPSFPLDWPFFKQPLERWLLHPSESSGCNAKAHGFHHEQTMSPTWRETLLALNAHGFHKIVLLGGASLTSSLLMADVVDELQLTFSPRVLGGQYTWVPLSEDCLPSILADSDAWTLENVESVSGNELVVRYSRSRFKSF